MKGKEEEAQLDRASSSFLRATLKVEKLSKKVKEKDLIFRQLIGLAQRVPGPLGHYLTSLCIKGKSL